MLAKRIIPCLDVNHGRVVKGTNFVNLRDAGDPVEVAARYDAEGADELVFLDITASHEDRGILLDVVRRTAEVCFMPLTVGGGIRSLDDVRTLLNAGADKVSINSAAVRDPELVRRAARRFGSQCIVVNIDPKRVRRDGARDLGSPHQRRPRADRARGRRLGPRGRAAGGRRDRADQHGRRRDQERLRPGDDASRGRRGRASRWWPRAGRAAPSTCAPSWPRPGPPRPWPPASSIIGEYSIVETKEYLASHGVPVRRVATRDAEPRDRRPPSRRSRRSVPILGPLTVRPRDRTCRADGSSDSPLVLASRTVRTAGVPAHGDGRRSQRRGDAQRAGGEQALPDGHEVQGVRPAPQGRAGPRDAAGRRAPADADAPADQSRTWNG